MKYFGLLFIVFIVNCNQLMSQELSLKYIFREPKVKVSKVPLLILLHGYGSNEEDLFSFASQLPDNYLIVSARAPYKLGENSYAWYEVDFTKTSPIANAESAEKSRKLILKFIEELKGKFIFDEKQIYLCGFSQGAIMSYCVGLTNPTKVKGIAVMSGRLLNEVKPLISTSDDLKKINVLITHGTNDTVLGIHYAREANAFLKSLGIAPIYKEYEEGHSINNAMLTELKQWLTNRK